MPSARRHAIDYNGFSDDQLRVVIERELGMPTTFAHNIKFRLATEADDELLQDLTQDAVKAADGSLHGHQLACLPEEYWEEFDRRLDMIMEHSFFTCVVAEFVGQGFRIPDGTILGYTLWGWVEYTEDADGGTMVRMGMLPRVIELWHKYLGGERPIILPTMLTPYARG
jgi:hypothetical protein